MLETVSSSAYDLITSSRFWMILLVAIFFLVVAVYVYNKHVSPMVDNDFIDTNFKLPSGAVVLG